jgi:SAM-dependent methyltransferase
MPHLDPYLLAFIERWLPPAPARVLEVGCAEGTLTRHLLGMGFDATGIDPQAPPGEHLVRSTLEQFGATNRFDAAVAVRSLHHVGNLTAAVERLHSMIRPEGRLVLFEFAVEHVDAAARRWLAHHGLDRAFDHDFSGVIPLGELRLALSERFRPIYEDTTPYLARELGRDDLQSSERAAIAEGQLREIGARLVYERMVSAPEIG